MMRPWLQFLLAVPFLLAFISPWPVQAASRVTSASVDYIFAEQAVFRASVQSDVPLLAAQVLIRSAGETQTIIGTARVDQAGPGSYQLTYTHNLTQDGIRAFSQVSYWFEITPSSGQPFKSQPFSFYYEDNRFNWQVREDKPFRLHWHNGDLAFAQMILDKAQAGLNRVQTLLPLAAPSLVNIYVYASASELQSTLRLAGLNWVAGHADPDLGIMVVALPPGPDQRLLVEQRIPHELMHIMLYNATGSGYERLPTWLNEGLASEAELYPNPDYQVLLENARQRGTLLSMADLCPSFPRDASGALLAYAQSASFTRFLFNNFGTAGLDTLVKAYANGQDCQQGAEAALGKSLNQLELQWREKTFAENAVLSALENFLPWLILSLAVLVAPLAITLSWLRRRVVTASH